MRVVSTFHSSSSVVDSLKCHLASNGTEHLVMAMLDRLEIYSVLPEGLVHLKRLNVSGRVVSIAAVPISDTDRSNILVLLDQPSPELLLVSLSDGALVFKNSLSLVEQARPAEFLTKVIVDPTGTIAIISCYTGKLTVVRLHDGDFNPRDAVPLNIPELHLLEIIFVPSNSTFVIALLHYDSWRRIQMLAREISLDSGPIPELSPPADLLPKTVLPNKGLFVPSSETPPRLIPVGTIEEGGGLMVIGGKKILFYTFAEEEEQKILKNKRTRLEKRKSSKDPEEVEKAKEKEKERENRKRKARHEIQWPWSEITAICPVHDANRWLIGDTFGRLSLLTTELLVVQGIVLIPLGETSSSSSLTYLSNQHLFVGSLKGDSQIVKVSVKPLGHIDTPTLPIPSGFMTIAPSALQTSTKGKQKATQGEESDQSSGVIVKTNGTFLETIQTFKNIGPILDATIFSDSSGETQIVTCSGGSNTGSVNVLRNGANYQELAMVKDFPGIRRIWPIRKFFEDRTHTHIALSTTQTTHILRFDSTTSVSYYDSSSPRGFATSQSTLAMSNVVRKTDKVYENGTYVIQVTPSSVKLFEHEMGLDDYDQVGNDWLPTNGGRIVSASIHASLIALGITHKDGHELVVLRMVDLKVQKDNVLEIFGRATVPHEISAISCAPIDKSAKFTHRVIVAYWATNVIEIFGFNRPQARMLSQFVSLPLPSLPQSILLFNFGSDQKAGAADHHPYLLVGMCNGSVVSLGYSVEEAQAKLSDPKIVANLGPAPISLTPCVIDGQKAVFASGSRGSLLSWQNQRIRSSSLLLKDVVIASNLNTEQHPNSFIIGTLAGFSIGRIADLDHMHIRTIPLGVYTPRRIVHDPHCHAFGVAVNRTEARLIGGLEPAYNNHFWVLDESTFERLHEFSLPRDEVITALTTFDFEERHYFCLGTYIFKSDESEASSGRIVVLEAETSNGTVILKQVAETRTAGAVYALSTLDHDLLAATIGSAIVLFTPEKPEPAPESSLVLRRLAEKNQNYVATNLDAYGQSITVGDMLGSVSSWSVQRTKATKSDGSKFRNVVNKENTNPGTPQKAELNLIKRDYHPLCPTSIISTDDGEIVGSDLYTNLFSFNKALERDGHFHLGDMVNTFIRGSLVSTDPTAGNKLEAESIFVTSSGRIGVIINIKDVDVSLHLTNVDRNLRYIAGNAGGTSIARFRAPHAPFSKPTDGAVGFLDGDFLELVLALSPEDLSKVMSGKNPGEKLKMSAESMRDIIEQLQALH